MAKESFAQAVNGVQPEQQGAIMRKSVEAVAALWPAHTGIIVFTFDFGPGGGMAYAANAVRADCIKSLKEWIRHAEQLS